MDIVCQNACLLMNKMQTITDHREEKLTIYTGIKQKIRTK